MNVALCVALVIVVVSVMSGFLHMVQSSGRTLMGDVIVTYGISGLPHYDELIAQLEENSNVLAATPIVDGWGLLRMPYPESEAKQSETVQVWGIEPISFAKVTSYDSSLQWKTPTENQRDWLLLDVITENQELLRDEMQDDDWNELVEVANSASSALNYEDVGLWAAVQQIMSDEQWSRTLALDERLGNPDAILEQGLTLMQNGRDGIVSGLHVSEGNERQKDGTYEVVRHDYWWLPRFDGTLTMLPVDSEGGVIEPESVILPFVNEFQSATLRCNGQGQVARYHEPLLHRAGMLELFQHLLLQLKVANEGVPLAPLPKTQNQQAVFCGCIHLRVLAFLPEQHCICLARVALLRPQLELQVRYLPKRVLLMVDLCRQHRLQGQAPLQQFLA